MQDINGFDKSEFRKILSINLGLSDIRISGNRSDMTGGRRISSSPPTAMTKNPVTVPMDSNVEEAAEILLKHNIPSVLVTHHDGEVAGTFSQSDGLNALITVTGIKKKHPICFASGGSVGGRQES